jgi:hypothetical protein
MQQSKDKVMRIYLGILLSQYLESVAGKIPAGLVEPAKEMVSSIWDSH